MMLSIGILVSLTLIAWVFCEFVLGVGDALQKANPSYTEGKDAMTEKMIQNEILRRFGTRPDMRLWRANVGVARIGKRVIRFGVPGQADLTGILADGRRLEIEVKSATGRQSPEQKAYQQMIERLGGLYILARSVQDVECRIQGWLS